MSENHPIIETESKSAQHVNDDHLKMNDKIKPPADLVIETPNNRNQNVLGGDLSGVSRKKSFNINYLNWIVAAIVVLILIAFFWPKSANKAIDETPTAATEQALVSEPAYTNSRIAEDEVIAETVGQGNKSDTENTFSRQDDSTRADLFREHEKSDQLIEELLNNATNLVASNNLTIPKEGNALDSYTKVLQLDPGNSKAKQGITFINDYYLEKGLKALEDGKEKTASSALTKLTKIDPESEQHLELSTQITNWQQNSKITSLLKSASMAYSNESYILPPSKNALHFYQQVLETDPDNTNAQNGISQIANKYIEFTNTAIYNGQHQTALGYLTTAGVINPSHKSIPLLKDKIAQLETIATQRKAAAEPVSNKSSMPGTTIPSTVVSPAIPLTPKVVSNSKTPVQESTEQELIDRQYLERGLSAYYSGDYNSARALLQPLADKGIARAQLRIGYMHFLGRGYPQDKQQADRVVRAALPALQNFANEGLAWAQSDLGSLYEDGLVIPKDHSEAVFWYRLAAEQGYAGAQTNLGIMYAYGRGVTANRQTAIKWFTRAANQGDVVAKKNLTSLGVK